MISRGTYRLLVKECIIHIGRGRGVSNIFLFPGAAVFSVSFVLKIGTASPFSDALIIWIMSFLCSLNLCSDIYSHDFAGGHIYFLKLYFSFQQIFLSKFIFNCIAISAVSGTVSILYIFLNSLSGVNYGGLAVILPFISLCLSSVFSALGIISASAQGKNALFGILSIPLVTPVTWYVVYALSQILAGNTADIRGVFFLLLYSIFTAIVSFLVFEKIWERLE